MVKISDIDSSWRPARTFQHMRRSRPSPLGLFLLSVIAIVVTLPMISCLPTVSEDQCSIQEFRKIGCKGTYNLVSMKKLSQICLNHSHGYDDSNYKECRNKCFMSPGFHSSAAMHYFSLMNVMNAEAWEIYASDIWTLNGFDPRTRRAHL